MATKKNKNDLEKSEEAKKKADELFDDVLTAVKPDKSTKPTKSTKEVKSKDSSWLENQVKALSDRVEELEGDLETKTLDYQKLYNQVGGIIPDQSDDDTRKNIRTIFEELRKNYEGLNSTRTRYAEAKIKPLLEKFLKSFPFLLEGKKKTR